MLELYQHEECAECRRVRAKLCELLLDYVVRQVPRDVTRRTRLEVATGQSEIPALVDPEERMIITEADDIIAYLEETYGAKDAAP